MQPSCLDDPNSASRLVDDVPCDRLHENHLEHLTMSFSSTLAYALLKPWWYLQISWCVWLRTPESARSSIATMKRTHQIPEGPAEKARPGHEPSKPAALLGQSVSAGGHIEHQVHRLKFRKIQTCATQGAFQAEGATTPGSPRCLRG